MLKCDPCVVSCKSVFTYCFQKENALNWAYDVYHISTDRPTFFLFLSLIHMLCVSIQPLVVHFLLFNIEISEAVCAQSEHQMTIYNVFFWGLYSEWVLYGWDFIMCPYQKWKRIHSVDVVVEWKFDFYLTKNLFFPSHIPVWDVYLNCHHHYCICNRRKTKRHIESWENVHLGKWISSIKYHITHLCSEFQKWLLNETAALHTHTHSSTITHYPFLAYQRSLSTIYAQYIYTHIHRQTTTSTVVDDDTMSTIHFATIY